MKRENGEVERRRRRANRIGVGEETKSQKTEGKTEGREYESTRKEEKNEKRMEEKERVETERVALLQESEWTLPPGMFF